ncbi:MAG: response regulator [Methanomicrobium sp.]|nr:response regulator [Methanomicrobium sp.]
MTKILIADDNEDMCQIISDVMREEGYMVTVAYDGESALNELRRDSYDLIILDYKLYDMSGLEVLETLRQQTMPLPVTIMISAYGNESVKSKARELGVYDFFDKPFDVDILLKVVKKAVNSGQ